MYDAGAWSKLVTTCVHSSWLVRGLCHSYADAKVESESPASIACIKLILNGKFLDNDEVLAGEEVLRCCGGMATLAFLVLVFDREYVGQALIKTCCRPSADADRPSGAQRHHNARDREAAGCAEDARCVCRSCSLRLCHLRVACSRCGSQCCCSPARSQVKGQGRWQGLQLRHLLRHMSAGRQRRQ